MSVRLTLFVMYQFGIVYQWKELVDSIKLISEEGELGKISSWSKYMSAGKSNSKLMTSNPSGPSLLEESFDQERLFKEAEDKWKATMDEIAAAEPWMRKKAKRAAKKS